VTDTGQATDAIAVTVNGTPIEARKGELIIEAAERNGVYIPRFCYHPRMKPVGMCRMCIVEVDTGRGPALQPSCMLECTPDMVVNTESEVTKKAQDGVLEFLLINHPLDCPVCDKGGECPLQDQTMAYGPGESRFVEVKRHFEKPIAISELVYLDRERCILCDRCTRFSADVAGDPLISFIDRGNQTQVNTFPDHPFASYFSGNTVQICPVGALTAEPYRFKARPWDLEQTESTCQGCSVGCRVAVQTSRNRVLRYQGVDIDPVNWGWLCDKGRFGFESVHSDDRLSAPLLRGESRQLEPVTWSDALNAAAETILKGLNERGPAGVAVIGGSRLTNEDAYAWAKLAKGVIGTDNVDCQIGDGLPAELVLGLPRATIDEVCEPGGTVLLIGPDLKEELPVLYLRLRHAAVNDGVKVIEISPTATGFTPYATVSLHPRPGEVGQVVRALLAGRFGGETGGVAGEDLGRAAALLTGNQPTLVAGRASMSESDAPVVDAVAALVGQIDGLKILPVLRRANVNGALDMGLAPGFLPGRVTLDDGRDWFAPHWSTLPASTGLDTEEILEAAAEGRIETLVLLGADLSDFPDRDLAERALQGAKKVIALDLFLNESSSRADVVLPAAGFAECDGTTTNIEGRVSTLRQRVTPPGTARSDWMIAAELAFRMKADLGLESVDDIWSEIERLAPSHNGMTHGMVGADWARDGLVVGRGIRTTIVTSGGVAGDEPVEETVARPATATFDADLDELVVPAPDGYGLRLVATRKLYDTGTLAQHSPSLAGLAPGTEVRVNPYDFDRLGVEAGDEVNVSSASTQIVARVRVDGGVPRGTAAMVFNQPDLTVAALIDNNALVNDIRVETAD
jgi:NADH-quinone oxidoreductase subunit G